jgi:hypothetical protein
MRTPKLDDKLRLHTSSLASDPRHRKWIGLAAVIAAVVFVAVAWTTGRFRHDDPSPSVAAIGDAVPELPSTDALGQVATPLSSKQQELQRRKFDPANDGWHTEDFIERIHLPLSTLKAVLTQPGPITAKDVAGVVTDGFVASPMRPNSLTDSFRQGPLTVRRPSNNASATPLPAHRGAEGLAAALGELRAPLEGATDFFAHAKTVRVDLADDVATTRMLLEIAGNARVSGAPSVVQIHATYECQWRFADSESPRLAAIRTLNYEESLCTGNPWLADVTRAVLEHNAAYRDQLAYGLNHWLGRIERSHDMDVYGRHGMAVGDVNGDGLDDVYLCQPGGLPNRLFVQNPDGTATDRAHDAGIDWLDRTASAIFADLDNDGHQDLVVATFSGLLVMQNNGKGRFELKTTLPLTDNDVQSLSAVDYDNDGDLDLYICTEFANLARYQGAPPPRFVYHDANDGGKNVLFRNELGRWKFTDVTEAVGLDADNRRHSLAAAWEDFDNDGDQDLYVANDYGQKCLYRNDGGKFINIAAAAGVTDFGSGMSVAWGDVNRDGWMDLYVANMFSSAGNRITRQAGFMTGIDVPTRQIYQRFAKGNSLFANQADGSFREIGGDAGVEMGRWAWSSLFADLNNDGWEDILVDNGYITGDETDDL